jgi:N-carbamoyl-L-amino-acid hydrolase
MSLMQEAGMTVRIDAGSNIIGNKQERNPKLPVIALGSHIDSVPEGGYYDGALGVLSAIEAVQVLHENGIVTQHPIEVIVFTDEEGGLIGSRCMIGKMTPEEALEVVSHSGKTVRQGILALGGNPDNLAEAIRDKNDMKSFIELHIEQGSSLIDEGIDIGIVEGIVGIHWWDVTIEGIANHAGTTPMDRRQDALLTAAHLIIVVNTVVTPIPGRQVGTVGRIKTELDAPNVIPGKVVMSLEIRDLSEQKINSIYEKIVAEANNLEWQTHTKITFHSIDAKSIPAPMEAFIKARKRFPDKLTEDIGMLYIPEAELLIL